MLTLILHNLQADKNTVQEMFRNHFGKCVLQI